MNPTSVWSNLYRAMRRGTLFKALGAAEPFVWVRQRDDILEFGTKYGRWALHRSGLSASTVMLSFGLGEDISFEQALLERGVGAVHGFDPTPRSLAYLDGLGPLRGLSTHPIALAAHHGTLEFALPPGDAADQVSASAVAAYGPHDRGRDTANQILPGGRHQPPTPGEPVGHRITVACQTLADARRLCGAGRVDIVKMDIEGAEYAVVDQALADGSLDGVSQLMVEFHHFLPGLHPHQTRRAIHQLEQVGFEIAWVGRTNHEYLFLRPPR